MKIDGAVHIILWIFLGSLCVLVITHAKGFATAVTAVGGQVTNDASLLAGYAPANAAGTHPASVNAGGLGA